MLTTLKKAAVAGLVGLTALAAVPASADSLRFRIGDDDARLGIYLGDSSRHGRWREERRHERRGCSPDRALDKAERMGIRRARIDYVSRNEIAVVGRSRGDRVYVTFARERGCPVLSY